MYTLETDRTILRPLRIEDAGSMYELNLDPEVIKYTGDHSFSSEGEATTFLEEYISNHQGNTGRFAVIQKVNGVFIGWCGLSYSKELNEHDIGFRFFKKFWNKGYATETAARCLEFGFEVLKLERIVGRAMKENYASVKVLEKIGMNFTGIFDFSLHEGRLYTLSSEEFFRTHLKK